MRVATNQFFNQGLSNMLRQQAALLVTQDQISSGLRIRSPSDDPAGAVRVMGLESRLADYDQYAINANMADARLSLEESILGSVNNLMQGIREKTLQAANASQSSETRSFIASEIQEKLNALLDLGNTIDANGEYLFAGNRSDSRPFTRDAAGNYSYNGDQGQRFAEISDSQRVAMGDSGQYAFFDIPTGNGQIVAAHTVANTGAGKIGTPSVSDPTALTGDSYTITFSAGITPSDPVQYTLVNDTTAASVGPVDFHSGDSIAVDGITVQIEGEPDPTDVFTLKPAGLEDIFSSIQNLIGELQAPTTLADGHINNVTNRALEQMDQFEGRTLRVRSELGGRLNGISEVRDANDTFTLQVKSTLSNIRDLDIAEAASRLSYQTVVLEAAQAAFVRTQNLSLFNFI